MRIGIDCRLAGTKHAGIGRYIQNLLLNLLPDSEHQWVLFFFSQDQAETVLGSLKAPNIKIVIASVPHYTIAEQLRMPFIFRQENLDLLHVPHFNVPLLYRRPFVVTIHDLLWHHNRGSQVTTLSRYQYWLKYLFYRLIVRNAVLSAKKVIVPAKTIKQTVTEYFPAAANKTEVTHEGVDESILKSASKSERKTAGKTLLYVGSLYPHKNVRLVIAALHKLPEYTLEIVGSRDIFSEQTLDFAKSLNLSGQVKMLGYLTDQELQQKYQGVSALVQPSLSEGFGLTGIEAMALGTPVLASDIAIFREIYKDGAILFNPHHVAAFVEAVEKLEKSDLNEITARAQAVAKSYSWKTMATQTLQIYEQTN